MRRRRGTTPRPTACAAALLVAVCPAGRAGAVECRLLRFTFEVAARPAQAVAPHTLELPPQIAVWLEDANGAFVDTLMVTSAVALRGIGNRPGRWDLPSGPKFPYGRRPMALPVWAHARGHLYPSVVMEDGDEADLMGHEATSSPEPFFCRPMLPAEVVDAVTCASGLFRSAKGVFATDGSMSYYPPRGDLLDLLAQPCPPLVNRPRGSCDVGDSPGFAVLDDLDAVAAATPEPGAPYSGSWIVPPALPATGYALVVEVSKEFDTSASYDFPVSEGPLDGMYSSRYGLPGNLGQPSVVYRLPVTLAVGETAVSAASAGHGDPLGTAGTLFAPDGTLSSGPGSGEARLTTMAGPAGAGRVHVEIDTCPVASCLAAVPLPEVAADVAPSEVTATSAVVEIRQDANIGQGVLDYEVRYRPLADDRAADPAQTSQWAPGPTIAATAPGALSTAMLTGLAPDSGYVVSVRAKGICGDSPPTLIRFLTPPVEFRQLSGCFIASAAFPADAVATLRQERDALVRASGLAAVAADIYHRSAPPLADLIKRSAAARALTRTWLRAPVTIARAVAMYAD